MTPTGDPNSPNDPDAARPPVPSAHSLNAEIAARARQAAGRLRIGELARLAGSNPETVRRYMAGQTRIPAWFVARIAECLGVPAEWLLYGQRRDSAQHPPTAPNDAGHRTPQVHSAEQPGKAADA